MKPQPASALKLLSGFVLCAIITGCSTPYKSNGLMGGYTATQLAPDVFRVKFKGNGYTSDERAQDFALRRAAELCLTNGLPWFAIINETAGERTMSQQLGGHAYTTGNASVIGGQVYYSGQTHYTPGPVLQFRFPTAGILVQGFGEKPANIYTFNCAFVLRSMAEKYRIKPPPPAIRPQDAP